MFTRISYSNRITFQHNKYDDDDHVLFRYVPLRQKFEIVGALQPTQPMIHAAPVERLFKENGVAIEEEPWTDGIFCFIFVSIPNSNTLCRQSPVVFPNDEEIRLDALQTN